MNKPQPIDKNVNELLKALDKLFQELEDIQDTINLLDALKKKTQENEESS
jgi:prefoldin subunit 5